MEAIFKKRKKVCEQNFAVINVVISVSVSLKLLLIVMSLFKSI